MRQLKDSFAFKNRGKMARVLFAPALIALLFSTPVVSDNSMQGLALYMVGWLFFMLYIMFRIWATLYVGGRKDSELQTTGPYSITRNPLYFGTFCLALAMACFLKSFSLIVIIFIGFVIYSRLVIKAEEGVLGDIFGEDFKKYCATTPRFFPSLKQYHSPEVITVKLHGLKTEAKRLWLSVLIPVTAAFITHLRMAPWWPYHWFKLP